MFYQASMQGCILPFNSFLSEDGLQLSNMCDKMGGNVLLISVWGGGHHCSVWLLYSFLLLSIREVIYCEFIPSLGGI
jgi:hypothetical protein